MDVGLTDRSLTRGVAVCIYQAGSGEGRVFYPLRRHVSVSQAYLRVDGISYEVAKLRHIEVAKRPAVGRQLAYRLIGVETLVALTIAVVAWSYQAVVVALGYLIVASGTLLIALRRHPLPLELSAWYDGRWAVLYVSVDHTEFHQIQRALARAIENHYGGG